MNQSPGRSCLHCIYPEPRQDQTFCGRGLEICGFNQCPRDWSQSHCSARWGPPKSFYTRSLLHLCVCVSLMLHSVVHSWRSLLSLACGNSSLFQVSRGSLWISHKPRKPFCKCLFIHASLFSRRKWNPLGGAPGLLGFCWGRKSR